MKLLVGTSGWLYSWNKDSSLKWYKENSGLNAVELNASFYRFPFPNQIKGWSKFDLLWSIKVNKLITHIHMLNESAIASFKRFISLFEPLEEKIAYYLFQFPPRFSTSNIDKLKEFLNTFDNRKFALEFRNKTWYEFDFSKLDFNGVIVTPDSPEIHNKIFIKNEQIYIRFHGRSSWYAYNYKEREIREVIENSIKLKPKVIAAFFNNDHDMLGNARLFFKIAKSIVQLD